MQELFVALMVFACTAYAVWSLLPRTLRRELAQRAEHWPLPRPLASRVKRAAQAPSGCGCDGCDGKSPVAPPAGAVQPIRLHRAARR
ncbi:MAG TPA: hypothetical protein VE029_04680 [Rhizobacter sp.]|nr:hypothetical protein [Rhizobacter sp.]